MKCDSQRSCQGQDRHGEILKLVPGCFKATVSRCDKFVSRLTQSQIRWCKTHNNHFDLCVFCTKICLAYLGTWKRHETRVIKSIQLEGKETYTWDRLPFGSTVLAPVLVDVIPMPLSHVEIIFFASLLTLSLRMAQWLFCESKVYICIKIADDKYFFEKQT